MTHLLQRIPTIALVGTLILGAMAFCTTATLAQDNVIRACVRSSGVIRIIASGESCRSNETLTTWPATAPSGGGGGLHVVDSTGQILGPFIDASSVVIDIAGTQLRLIVTADGFLDQPAPLPSAYYVNPDCTGTQYLSPSGVFGSGVQTPLFVNTYVYAGTAYYAEPPFEVLNVFLGDGSTCSGPQSVLVGQLASFETSSLGFTPTFHVAQ